MTGHRDDPVADDPLLRGVRLHASRRRRWAADGDMSVGKQLGQIGVLGWIIVVPMLLGIFGGRWLDVHFHSSLFWTAPLLMAGAALGCWSAWKWMHTA